MLQSSRPGVMGAERRALLNSAAGHFRQALEVRPLWPYGWVNLLAVKDKLGEMDREFNSALRKSAELGPWESRVQLQVVESGLRFWGELGTAERGVVQQKVLDAFKVQPHEIFVIIKDYGRPDLVCDDHILQHRQVSQWCETVFSFGQY